MANEKMTEEGELKCSKLKISKLLWMGWMDGALSLLAIQYRK